LKAWVVPDFGVLSRESSSHSFDETFSTEEATAILGIVIILEVELSFLDGVSLVLACKLLIESSRPEVYPLTVVPAILSVEFSLEEFE
jgi:hypothetical protein